MTISPAERPRDLNALINDTIGGYQRGFPVLVVLSLLGIIPNLVYAVIAGPHAARLAGGTLRSGSDFTNVITEPTFLAGAGLAFIIGLIGLPFFYAGPYAGALAVVEEQPVTVGSALSAVAQRYLSAWGLIVIIGLVIVGLCITCIGIPFAIWIGVRWAFALPALFKENRGAMAALGTSWEIVRNNWWRTFGLLLLVGLSVAVVSAIIGTIFGVVTLAFPEAVRPGLQSLLSGVVSGFLGPITVLYTTLLYFDLRARRMAMAGA